MPSGVNMSATLPLDLSGLSDPVTNAGALAVPSSCDWALPCVAVISPNITGTPIATNAAALSNSSLPKIQPSHDTLALMMYTIFS
jgi:hypothetical protein